MFTIDAARSRVEFVVRFLGLVSVRGTFGALTGTVVCRDGECRVPAEVSASIDVSGLDTGLALRDHHLRSRDYFDTRRYPAAVFRSTQAVPTISGFALTGALTLHGRTDVVNVDVDIPVARSGGPDGARRLVARGDATIYRSDFAIGGGHRFWNLPHLLIGDQVDVHLHVEASTGG